MATIKVEKNTYTTEELYQWDVNQQLEVRGLSLASVPEVHFHSAALGDRAIVRQGRLDAAGVLYAEVPNSLLQKPYRLTVYICAYTGDTFETLYALDIPVKQRAKPSDYTLENDGEVYSFNALEAKANNALVRAENAEAAASRAAASASSAAESAAKVDGLTANDVGAYSKEEVLTDATRGLFGLPAGALPDAVFEAIFNRGVTVAGTYKGSGKSGAENPNTLDIGFKPKLLVVFTAAVNSGAHSSTLAVITEHGGLAIHHQTSMGDTGARLLPAGFTYENGIVSWYAEYAQYQCSYSSQTYAYAAIG